MEIGPDKEIDPDNGNRSEQLEIGPNNGNRSEQLEIDPNSWKSVRTV
jgi:hypothetical protein